MNAIIKRIVEITGGVLIGVAASEAIEKVVDITKKAVENHKKG